MRAQRRLSIFDELKFATWLCFILTIGRCEDSRTAVMCRCVCDVSYKVVLADTSQRSAIDGAHGP